MHNPDNRACSERQGTDSHIASLLLRFLCERSLTPSLCPTNIPVASEHPGSRAKVSSEPMARELRFFHDAHKDDACLLFHSQHPLTDACQHLLTPQGKRSTLQPAYLSDRPFLPSDQMHVIAHNGFVKRADFQDSCLRARLQLRSPAIRTQWHHLSGWHERRHGCRKRLHLARLASSVPLQRLECVFCSLPGYHQSSQLLFLS
mmetsp:Transcript_13702/g.31610  ORF Transcript_13702/g.31610 Transcript_13702/m.31610 type:complete len:203 (+) Transcript_13702:275-883(+)